MTQEPQKKHFLSWYFKVNLLSRIMIGLISGIVVGCLLGLRPEMVEPFVNYTKFFGDIFLRLLKMIVVPVIFFSLITGAASISPSRLGRVGVKTLVFYLSTSVVAAVLGLVVAHIIQPGFGFGIVGEPGAISTVAQSPSISQMLLNIVPTNPVEALAKGEVLPIIFFSLVFGLALAVVRESKIEAAAKSADSVYRLCSVCADIMYQVVAGIMQYAPVGVFVLISIVFARHGPQSVGPLLLVVLTYYLALILHVIICYGGLLAIFKIGFGKFVKSCYEASVTAFVTRSSNGTLPITMRVSEEKLGVPRSISSFALPLGATLNMDGSAIYLSVCTIFIGFATGNPLSLEQQLTVVITATLASIGTAGVPGATAIMLLMVLESVGLSITDGSAVAAAYAMIFGIDAFLDMGRTSVNVTGDMTAVVVIAKSEKSLDMSKW